MLLSLGAWAQTDSIAAPADTLAVDSLATDTLATDSVAKFDPYAVPDSLVVMDSTAMQPTEAPDGPAPEIEYSVSRQTYEIAGIKVTGAENYEDFVIIGFSGLAVGDKVDIPGDQITKALKRFWKQGQVRANVYRADDGEYNYMFLVRAFASNDTTSKPLSLDVQLRDIQLHDVVARYDSFIFKVPEAEMSLHHLSAGTVDAEIKRFGGSVSMQYATRIQAVGYGLSPRTKFTTCCGV